MPNQQVVPAAQAQHALLPAWANAQDGWCRSITAEILKNRTQPSDAAIDEYLKNLLAEKKLSDEAFDPLRRSRKSSSTPTL